MHASTLRRSVTSAVTSAATSARDSRNSPRKQALTLVCIAAGLVIGGVGCKGHVASVKVIDAGLTRAAASGAGGASGSTAAGAGGASGGRAAGAGGASGSTAAGGGGASGSAGGAGGAAGAGSTALVNPAPGSKFFVGANFYNIDWQPKEDYFVAGTDFATIDNPWQPQLIADVAPYKVIRFMDFNGVNNENNPQASWDTRSKKTDNPKQPVAFEWQIDFCNRTLKDYWVNIPAHAAPDYWPKLAQLIKDQLDPRLRVYVEWSNEVWNAGFFSNGFAAQQAKSLGLPTHNDAASAYYVYESVRMFDAFESVFGKNNPRLVKVLAGQAVWNGPCQDHVAALSEAKVNPTNQKPNVYAIAPYINGKSVVELKQSTNNVAGWIQMHLDCVKDLGIPVISYEGGQDSFSLGNQGCATLAKDPGMHDVYTGFLDAMSNAKMGGPFMQYAHVTQCWGVKEKTSDTTDQSPKYKGIVDWVAAHP